MRILGRIALILIALALAAGIWFREELGRLSAVLSLFDEDRIVANFSSMDTMFLTAPVPRGDGPVSPLPRGTAVELRAEIETWITDRSVTSLMILKEGEIVFEEYYLGTGPEDRRISWSIAKSFLSALFGTLVESGEIESLDALVTTYVPELAGSAYEGATIEDVLQMESGIVFDEDYLDFWSDINRMGRVLALGRSMDAFAAAQDESFAAPGTDWQYTSIDTHVLGMVARSAAGQSLVDLMSGRIVGPLGLEAELSYVTDGRGVAFALGGLNLTTRDYARFGQMILQGGWWQGAQVVPADWVEVSTTPSALTDPGAVRYGYQWWMPNGYEPGEFLGQGIYGQFLYIHRGLGVVIVVTSADRMFREPGVLSSNHAMLARIARGL